MSFAEQENYPPISIELFNVVRVCVPKGGVILELGSGPGSTVEFKKAGYEVWSIEHSPRFYGVYNDLDFTLKAPFEPTTEFYDMELIKNSIPNNYQALLVDGPDTESRLYWFGRRLHYFKNDVPWFFDDWAYKNWKDGFKEIANELQRELVVFEKSNKQFAVLLGKNK